MFETTGTQLVHWSEGRLRIKNRALRQKSDLAYRIESGLRNAIGIRTAKVNWLTASLLVEYDAAAWRNPEGTRQFWSALCNLFPDKCNAEGCAIPVGRLSNFAAVRDAVIAAFEAAPGVTEVRHEPASQTLRIEFDPQRFALEPVLRSLTARVARSAQVI
jgi:hypothetical protein